MKIMKLGASLAIAALLCGCEAKIGKGDEAAAAGNGSAGNAPVAEAKAEDGKISLKAPGVDLSINIPEGVAGHMTADADDSILYPGSRIAGLAIAATGEPKAGGDGADIGFTSADAPDKLLAWYRDPARAKEFTLVSEGREGDAVVLNGRTTGSDTFTLRLAPGAGGGTEGKLAVRDRS